MVLYGPFGGGQRVGPMAEQGPMRHGQGAGQQSHVGPCQVAIEGRWPCWAQVGVRPIGPMWAPDMHGPIWLCGAEHQ